MEKLINMLEKDITKCVMLLREYGFNTFCSCGCPPNPYIQMECYSDDEITKLYKLLIEKGYKDFAIKFSWDMIANSRCLEIIFNSIDSLRKGNKNPKLI